MSIISFAGQQKIQKNAPAIWTPEQSEKLSDKYQLVDTGKVIESLRQQGFQLRTAAQVGSGPSAKHLVRMTSNITLGDGNLLEAVIKNAHNGTSILTIMLGVFRLICSNGAVVGCNEIEPLKLRHIGDDVQKQVLEALMRIDEQRKIVAHQVDAMQNTTLSGDQIVEFGKQALVLAFGEEDKKVNNINANAITSISRRREDNGNTGWVVFNRVQENLLRGGLKLSTMQRRMRPVTNIDRDVKLNRGLWELAFNAVKNAA